MEQTQASNVYGDANIPASKFKFDLNDSRLILANMIVAFSALFLGGIAGLLQVLERAGFIALPRYLTYYQILTAHGVLLALVFTTFFIVGYLYSGVIRTVGEGKFSVKERGLGWVGFYMMLMGTIVATITILTNDATVLYTFYAPMIATPWFYIGLALVIVGSWLGAIAIFSCYLRWRKANKGKRSPLFAYMAVATMILWLHCTLAVVIEVLFQLIPWSFGWVERINIELSRTLFWAFGHALVYFWLLPAYIYWYVNIPKIVGGKIFSDSLPRLTFILFILFSIPVGFHHQMNEPGIESFWKFLQVVLTMAVIVPSLLTAFSILATFELAGREKGATGLFGWLKKLPWRESRFVAPFIAMVIFIIGGAGGVILASYQLNTTVHNTWFVTGHFHMTLATTVILTFFGISYWLIPILTGRPLTAAMNRLGIIQAITWGIGMLFLSVPMHIVGILGSPRRSSYSTYGDHEVALSWFPYYYLIAIGGILLFIGILQVIYIFIHMLLIAKKTDDLLEYPIGVTHNKAVTAPPILERWTVWITISVFLAVVAYGIPVMKMIQHAPPGALPFRSW